MNALKEPTYSSRSKYSFDEQLHRKGVTITLKYGDTFRYTHNNTKSTWCFSDRDIKVLRDGGEWFGTMPVAPYYRIAFSTLTLA